MTNTPHAHDTKTVIERYVSALETGDEAGVRASFAETATWRLFGDLPMSGFWEGRESILGEFLAGALGAYEPGSISLEITGLIVDGEQAVLEWTSRARTIHGEQYENFCIGVFTVRDGQIVSAREYLDTQYAARMLGVRTASV